MLPSEAQDHLEVCHECRVRLAQLRAGSKLLRKKQKKLARRAKKAAAQILARVHYKIKPSRLVLPEDPDVDEVVSPVKVTMVDQMGLIRSELSQRKQLSFRKMLRNSSNRLEVLVTFLAVLELVKQSVIDIEQEALFGDITIKARPVGSERSLLAPAPA